MRYADPTAFPINFDPTTKRMRGTAVHGNTPFDVPFISQITDNLWQGGCQNGLILPEFIHEVVSLYPWESYTLHSAASVTEIEMYDSEDQAFDQVDEIALFVNKARKNHNVLVHCQAGLNRSSLIAARALMLGPEMLNAEDAIHLLRTKRSPACLCNKSFEKWLLSR